jgi:hypothetical protein
MTWRHMTTRKRSKPRAVWVVLYSGSYILHTASTLREAISYRDSFRGRITDRDYFAIVKYVREVKRK